MHLFSAVSYPSRQPRLSLSNFLDKVLVPATQLHHYSRVHYYTRQIVASSSQVTGGIRKRGRPRKVLPLSRPEIEANQAYELLHQCVAELYTVVTRHVAVDSGHCSHALPGRSVCTG